MPSPFPGTDPYLEHPSRWGGVHHRLITYIGDELTDLLPPGYQADINERLYIVQPDRDIYPDVSVRETPTRGSKESLATLSVASDPPWKVTLAAEELHEGFIEIVHTEDPGRVVTIIEVLSPSNKTAGTEGRKLYRAEQREILAGPTHLLEIDFLRRGEHSVAAPYNKLVHKGVWDYLVSLSRGDHRDECEVWAVTLRQRLPRIRVPLLGDDPDVVLDLQEIVNRVYDIGGYADKLNYRGDPVPPFAAADAEWADAPLRTRALRP